MTRRSERRRAERLYNLLLDTLILLSSGWQSSPVHSPCCVACASSQIRFTSGARPRQVSREAVTPRDDNVLKAAYFLVSTLGMLRPPCGLICCVGGDL
ncbi:hypothetical protein C8T65DRAFT_115713 [Cerioporus squamosus]|nr:hypothetical protein C8T65DRAFT_115713 [Cerioporus squamosus]